MESLPHGSTGSFDWGAQTHTHTRASIVQRRCTRFRLRSNYASFLVQSEQRLACNLDHCSHSFLNSGEFGENLPLLENKSQGRAVLKNLVRRLRLKPYLARVKSATRFCYIRPSINVISVPLGKLKTETRHAWKLEQPMAHFLFAVPTKLTVSSASSPRIKE